MFMGNHFLEPNRLPGFALDAAPKFGRAFYARTPLVRGGRSGKR
jgi:hypothetical protein